MITGTAGLSNSRTGRTGRQTVRVCKSAGQASAVSGENGVLTLMVRESPRSGPTWISAVCRHPLRIAALGLYAHTGPEVYMPKFPARPIILTVVDEMCSLLASWGAYAEYT